MMGVKGSSPVRTCLYCDHVFQVRHAGAKYCTRACAGMDKRRVYLGTMKRCSKCSKYKDKTEFHKNKGEIDGLQGICVECRQNWKYKNSVDRFWKRFHERTVKVGDCLEWTGMYAGRCKTNLGMPACTWEGKKNSSIRRIVYRLSIGDLPDDMFVITSCNNRRCVKHSHMVKATREEFDAKRANRAPSGDRLNFSLYPELLPRGDKHWKRKQAKANASQP